MPVICIFENENIKIYIYNYDHRAPHIHIVKKGATPSKGVDMLLDGSLPHGSEGLSNKDIAVVRAWLQDHVEEVDAKWMQAEAGHLTDDELIPSGTGESLHESVVELKPYDEDAIATRIIPLPNKVFACEFNSGRSFCLFDMKPYLDKPAFKRLQDENVFRSIECPNGVPCWDNERIDIDPGYVLEHGKSITRKNFDYLMLMHTTNADSTTRNALAEGFLALLDNNDNLA